MDRSLMLAVVVFHFSHASVVSVGPLVPLTSGGVTRYRLLLTQINTRDRSLPIQLITLHQLFHGGCKVREHSGVLHVRLGTDPSTTPVLFASPHAGHPPSYAGTQHRNWTGERCAESLHVDVFRHFCTLMKCFHSWQSSGFIWPLETAESF